MTLPYLAGLRLAGRDVVVVGGGQLAQRRLPRLVEAGAVVTVIAPDVTPAVEGMAGADELTWLRRTYQPGDLAGAWYVLAVTDDPAVNAEVATAAERLRTFCVRGDDAAGGSAHTPAVGRHGSASIGVLGAGDPGRTAGLRDSIVRALQAEPAAGSRSGRGTVALVGGGPGDPDLITVRGRQLLAAADVVIADRLGPRALLEELSPAAEIVDATKLPAGPALAQAEINRLLVEHARAGRAVVRLKGGDAFVFGRGMEEVLACAAAGVPCVVVPGVTSAVGVPALAGIPVTHRGLAHEFTVVSGHLAPDDPRSLLDWPALARLRGTLVLLMAVRQLPPIVEVLLGHGRDPATPAAVVSDGSTSRQRTVVSTLGRLAADADQAGIRAPAVVVIGEVAAFARPAGPAADGFNEREPPSGP